MVWQIVIKKEKCVCQPNRQKSLSFIIDRFAQREKKKLKRSVGKVWSERIGASITHIFCTVQRKFSGQIGSQQPLTPPSPTLPQRRQVEKKIYSIYIFITDEFLCKHLLLFLLNIYDLNLISDLISLIISTRRNTRFI